MTPGIFKSCILPLLLGTSVMLAGTFEVIQVNALNVTADNGYVESTVKTSTDLPGLNLKARIYYYSKEHKLIASAAPVAIKHKGESERFGLPSQFHKNEPEKIRFTIPLLVRVQKDWSAVVTFGDNAESSAATVPATSPLDWFEFPEKRLIAKTEKIERVKYTADSLDQEICETNLPDYPKLTLFAKEPAGLAKDEKPTGVLCIVAIANSVDDIRRQLGAETELQGLAEGIGGWYDGAMACMLRYARKNKLMVVCWGGAHNLWNYSKNWDELTPEERTRYGERFEKVAGGWERGMLKLVDRHGVKPKDYLIWGLSASAQFAQRLVLIKPQYFRAAFIHVSSSFDAPTVQASSVLWCVTTQVSLMEATAIIRSNSTRRANGSITRSFIRPFRPWTLQQSGVLHSLACSFGSITPEAFRTPPESASRRSPGCSMHRRSSATT